MHCQQQSGENLSMPKPPILEIIDWQAVFASGEPFDAWLAAAADPDKGDKMAAGLAAQDLEPQTRAMLAALPRGVHVIAIAEDWCGDVVRHVPVLERIAATTPKVQTRYITRAQHKEVFVRFLTNGGEAVPKFVFLNDQFVECGNWGPMPEACKRLVARGKACGNVAAARQKVSALYQADADKSDVVRELVELVNLATAAQP